MESHRASNLYVSAAMLAAAGMVITHAHTILRVTPHRTADSRRVDPTPMMAPVMVCVVLTGIPFIARPNRHIAAALSAQNPPIGRNAVILWPMVFTILQPPETVPSAIALWAR